MDDDWDLQAVVRGCRLTSPAATSVAAERDPFSFFPPFDLTADPTDGDESFWRFSELLAAPAAVTELEQLCRPFSRPSPAVESSQRPRPPPEQSHVSRTKRSRKNQQKRVVCQVPADGAASDLWAWRKYGQKPIKGSPYPRGYYRCSSSKGCPARKQVERSSTDPSLLAITYTADHNHPPPTHRNSLAGTTRNKISTAAAASDSQPPEKPSSSPLSPTSPLVESMEDEMDELLFTVMEEVSGGGPTSADGGAGGADSDFLAGGDGLNEHFFPPSWMASNNNSSAATAL